MKFTLSWLKDYLETEASLDDIAATLTHIGLEVDSVDNPGARLKAFTVARVISADQHPDADRLRVCRVDTGSGEVQVVCGAPNARAGMKGVFAAAGEFIPGLDITLKAAKIRGVESNGMLLSEREVGLSDEHEGIIELPGEAPVGKPFAEFLGLDDPVIDIELTPNRPDCAGVRGIARDLAAAGLGTLKPFTDATPVPGTFDSPIRWAIANDGNACPYVVGRYFRGVQNGPSPAWMQRLLRAVGLRPISALVDITNYVTIALGRPLHVFDANKLAGAELAMRRARDGEEILALDGKTYRLDAGMTVIADPNGVHGIGGVMGGEVTGCTAATTELFLEVALFDPKPVANTGRALNLLSDARYRFERGVDTASADWGAEVAARLILDLCSGEASRPVAAGRVPDGAATIALRLDRVRTLGGVEVQVDRQIGILEDLGFTVAKPNGATLQVTAPTWRPDLHGEADLIEEIVRIHGIDKVEPVSMSRDSALPKPAITPALRRAGLVRRALAAQGLDEAVTWSFTAASHAALFGGVPDTLRLANPISADLDVMRPAILPNLIAAAGRNADRGFGDVALFELGPQYRDDSMTGQDRVAAGVRLGHASPVHWAVKARPADGMQAKADALAGLAAAGAPVDKLQTTTDAPAWYHPGRSGVLRLGPNVLARFGEVHPSILSSFDVRGPLAAFEIMLDDIPQPKTKPTARPPLRLSPFQPVHRDFAFVVGRAVTGDEVLRAARAGDKALISDITVFDVYTGEGIDDDKKSVAITVTLQPTKATLTDEQIEAVSRNIVAAVERRTNGVLRG